MIGGDCPTVGRSREFGRSITVPVRAYPQYNQGHHPIHKPMICMERQLVILGVKVIEAVEAPEVNGNLY